MSVSEPSLTHRLHKHCASAGKLPRCFLQALLQSVSSASLCTTAEVGTTTDGDLAGQAATQLALLDHRFDAGGAARTAPHIVSQKLADLQSQCDQRVALQVAAKVCGCAWPIHHILHLSG